MQSQTDFLTDWSTSNETDHEARRAQLDIFFPEGRSSVETGVAFLVGMKDGLLAL